MVCDERNKDGGWATEWPTVSRPTLSSFSTGQYRATSDGFKPMKLLQIDTKWVPP